MPPTDPLRLSVGFALGAGAAGLWGGPLWGATCAALVQSALLRRLGRRHRVRLSMAQAWRLAGAGARPHRPGRWAAARLLRSRRLPVRLGRGLWTLLRFDDMGRTVLLGLHFDRYCSRYHATSTAGEPGALPLQPDQLERLQQALQEASRGSGSQMLAALLRKVVGDLVRAGTALPRLLWSLATAAQQRDDGSKLERMVEQDAHGVFRALARGVEHELASMGQVASAALVDAFDRAWEHAGATAANPKQQPLVEQEQP